MIIAGGWLSDGNNILRSTEVLDLQTRVITSGGDMAQRRMWFRSGAIIGSAGVETLFAFGGQNRETYLDEVEECRTKRILWLNSGTKAVSLPSLDLLYFSEAYNIQRLEI